MSKFNALKSVENYTGASDVERWIDRINLAMEVDEIDQKKSGRIFAMKLDDAAYDTWKKMKAEDQTDCEKNQTGASHSVRSRKIPIMEENPRTSRHLARQYC